MGTTFRSLLKDTATPGKNPSRRIIFLAFLAGWSATERE
jgi:hypothetical protein